MHDFVLLGSLDVYFKLILYVTVGGLAAMQSKLTLRLDDALIEHAKTVAKARNTSVSELVSSYFSALDTQPAQPTYSPAVQRLKGLLRGSNASVEAYQAYLEEKYK